MARARRVLVVLALAAVTASALGRRVAVLANHDPTGWAAGSLCTNTSRALAVCNAGVYAASAATAAAAGASVLVLPEGYGLVGSASKSGYFEPLLPVGSTPCTSSAGAAGQPVQAALSCAALTNELAIAANLFDVLPNGTRRITEIVFDRNGTITAEYHKHHLFPVMEPSIFEPGPFDPTTVEVDGVVYGLIICYEGFYPSLTGDWSQMAALKARNASAFIWSVGDTVHTLAVQAKVLATKFAVAVIGTEDKEGAKADVAILSASGAAVAATDSMVGSLPPGYTASPFVRVATL